MSLTVCVAGRSYAYIVIADLYSDTIPACTAEAPDDG
jgi:hypothetical protein